MYLFPLCVRRLCPLCVRRLFSLFVLPEALAVMGVFTWWFRRLPARP